MQSFPSSQNSLAVCRWLWCKESFPSHNKLVQHVLDEHVAKAVPIKLKDLPLELRAQDGTSFKDSIPTQMLMEIGEDLLLDHEFEDDKDWETHEVLRPASSPPQEAQPAEPNGSPPPTTPLASPSSGFNAISSASSPSPELPSLNLGSLPSTAEIVAQVINRKNGHVASSSRSPIAGVAKSPKVHKGFRIRTGAMSPSPKRHNTSRHSLEGREITSQLVTGTQNIQKSPVHVKQEIPMVVESSPLVDPPSTNGKRAPELISSQAITSSQTAPDSQPIINSQFIGDALELRPNLSIGSHTALVPTYTINPAVLHQHSLPYSLSPGHEVSILEKPLRWMDPISPHTYRHSQEESTNTSLLKKPSQTDLKESGNESQFVPFQLDIHPDTPSIIPRQESSQQQESQLHAPHGTVPRFVHEVSQIHSSLEPSMISDISDIENSLGSQWPMQTQAPYNFDSQLTIDSQAQDLVL